MRVFVLGEKKLPIIFKIMYNKEKWYRLKSIEE